MIQTIDLRGVQPSRAAYSSLVPRPKIDVSVAIGIANTLIDDVKARGSEALNNVKS